MVLLKAGRGFTQPDIWIIDRTGTPRVWKTWGRRPAWERIAVGRWLARREAGIMRALEGLTECPRFLSHPHPWTIEMTLLDAEPVPETKGTDSLDARYFARLGELLAEMHRRGINHGDLRRKNLLRAPGNPSTPLLVDFTQCLHFRPPVRWLRGVIFRQAIRIDRVTLFKLKKWYLGEDALTEAERAELDHIPWHLKVGRFLRKRLYRPYKHWRLGKPVGRRKRSHQP